MFKLRPQAAGIRGFVLATCAKLAVVLASSLAILGGAELVYRRVTPSTPRERNEIEMLRRLAAGDPGRYRATPHTSYGLVPVRGEVNSYGFRGEEWTLEPAPGVTRILCLGGSTTEGGNANGKLGSYPYLLERGLAENLNREFEVLNCGVSAWTSAESLVTWFLLMQDFHADFVIMHNVVNDAVPRNFAGFRGDYSHWRTAWRSPEFGLFDGLLIRLSDLYAKRRVDSMPNAMELSSKPHSGPSLFSQHGVLPPDTSGAYRRNLISIGQSVNARGGVYCLMTMPARPPFEGDPIYAGIDEHNAIMREVAREHGWVLIDAAARFPGYPGYSRDAFFRDTMHLTAEGNRAKAILAGLAIAPHL